MAWWCVQTQVPRSPNPIASWAKLLCFDWRRLPGEAGQMDPRLHVACAVLIGFPNAHGWDVNSRRNMCAHNRNQVLHDMMSTNILHTLSHIMEFPILPFQLIWSLCECRSVHPRHQFEQTAQAQNVEDVLITCGRQQDWLAKMASKWETKTMLNI